MNEPFFDPYDPKERRWYRRLPRFLHKWAFVVRLAFVAIVALLLEGPLAQVQPEGMAYFRIGIVVLAAVAVAQPVLDWRHRNVGSRKIRWKEERE